LLRSIKTEVSVVRRLEGIKEEKEQQGIEKNEKASRVR
jgi:hypothetical protein